jgi:hypothetical protein
VQATRELVTRERPFHPVLVYVTDLALWPLGLIWLGGAIVLLLAHRGPFREASAWVRVRLLREGPEPQVEGPATPVQKQKAKADEDDDEGGAAPP